MIEDQVHKLRSLAVAYPLDIFPPVKPEEIKAHSGLITRNSAAMGRHFASTFTEAADTIERLLRDNTLMAEALVRCASHPGPAGDLAAQAYDDHRARTASP